MSDMGVWLVAGRDNKMEIVCPPRGSSPCDSDRHLQHLALARALVTSPELVLADEPTGNLDAWTGAGILKILTELSSETAQKFALVMVTHSPEAAAICDRVLTLEDGLLK